MPDRSSKNDNFFSLLVRSQKIVYAYILSMVHNCSDADDIMQETLTLMWERFDEFKPGTNFGAWGVKIARYKVLAFFKKRKRSEEKFDEALIEQIEDCFSHKSDEVKYRIVALQDCLKKLNERDRKLIEIHYEENTKITELAKRLNRPVPGLYKVMARIHTALRRCVNRTILSWDL